MKRAVICHHCALDAVPSRRVKHDVERNIGVHREILEAGMRVEYELIYAMRAAPSVSTYVIAQ